MSQDLDFTKPTFYVDIPFPNNGTVDEKQCIGEFKTREEALAFAKKHLGADDNGMISVITES